MPSLRYFYVPVVFVNSIHESKIPAKNPECTVAKTENWKSSLTHLNRMEFPALINLASPCWVIFFILIHILIEHSECKQWRP